MSCLSTKQDQDESGHAQEGFYNLHVPKVNCRLHLRVNYGEIKNFAGQMRYERFISPDLCLSSVQESKLI